MKFQSVLVLFCPFCSLSPLPSSAPSLHPASATSLEGVSLLIPPCTSFKLLKPLCVAGLPWCCKMGRENSGLVTPDINRRFITPLGCCLGLLAGANSLFLPVFCCLFPPFSLPFPSPQLQSPGLVLLVWKLHVMIVLLTKYSAVRKNSLGQPAGIRLKA